MEESTRKIDTSSAYRNEDNVTYQDFIPICYEEALFSGSVTFKKVEEIKCMTKNAQLTKTKSNCFISYSTYIYLKYIFPLLTNKKWRKNNLASILIKGINLFCVKTGNLHLNKYLIWSLKATDFGRPESKWMK